MSITYHPVSQYTSESNAFTIVELTVAVILASILSGILFLTWNNLNSHIINQKQKSSLRAESQRIAEQISTQLHKADIVLNWTDRSIIFTTTDGLDTVSYSFDGNILHYNGLPLYISAPHSSVRTFQLKNENLDDELKPYLFNLSIVLGNSRGDTVSAQTTVLVNRSSVNIQGDGFFF